MPDGPEIDWNRRDRDSESLALDPVRGTAWVGYEIDNQIWRYVPDFARAQGAAWPRLMRAWVRNQGVESLARLCDGRFIAIAERKPTRRLAPRGVLFGRYLRPHHRPWRPTYLMKFRLG